MELILASQSPRRREIMQLLNLKFRVITSDVEEDVIEKEMSDAAPEVIAQHLSKSKSLAVAEQVGSGLVLGADTIVVLDGKIYGKPSDESALREMMQEFSGRTHQVFTSVTITDAEKMNAVSATAVTEVTFRNITSRELDWYAANANYMDKAGGYAIQEHAALFISGICGCYYNVVGLPVQETLALLAVFGRHWEDFQ
jgi:septum formation protein